MEGCRRETLTTKRFETIDLHFPCNYEISSGDMSGFLTMCDLAKLAGKQPLEREREAEEGCDKLMGSDTSYHYLKNSSMNEL